MVVDIIVNLQACGGKAARRWQKFAQKAQAQGIKLRPHYTAYHRHATDLAQKLAQQSLTRLAVFGGDGTLNEVLNGLIADGRLINPNLPIAYIGAGSSCDFLKMFAEKHNPLERLTANLVRRVDVVQLKCQDEDGSPITRYFLANSSIGIISRSIELFNRNSLVQRQLKRWNIDLAALYAGIQNIITFNYFRAQLTIEDIQVATELKNISVLKSPYFGGGMHFAIASQPDDGLLHIAWIKRCSVGRTGMLLPALYQGTILTKPEASYRPTRRLVVDQVYPPLRIETDGEIVGQTPAVYTILPRFLPIVI